MTYALVLPYRHTLVILFGEDDLRLFFNSGAYTAVLPDSLIENVQLAKTRTPVDALAVEMATWLMEFGGELELRDLPVTDSFAVEDIFNGVPFSRSITMLRDLSQDEYAPSTLSLIIKNKIEGNGWI